ncbi:MAG: amino acid adenylation domain-containing protein [Cytophagales bacterium]|nr:amino acid adenylation domain-containing protein [Cytophagales bacterium]
MQPNPTKGTLIQILEERKDLSKVGITFIEKSDDEKFLSYKELYEAALNALSFLQDSGLKPKDELVFQVNDNRTFIVMFWACILGGIIPVPLSVGKNNDHKRKLFNIWQVLNHPYLIIDSKGMDGVGQFAHRENLDDPYLKMRDRTIILEEMNVSQHKGNIFQARKDDIAFIQFSSGSTGGPKGVMLTHENLLSNMNAISTAAKYCSEDSMLSWMPLTHDMGLIGFHLNPLFSGIQQYLIPTNTFIRRPALWLDKASQYGVTILCSPNFGYNYVLKFCNLSGSNWDLSAVRVLYNGAEPISENLCHLFLDSMSKFGLKRTAMCPVYGLAEATLAVTISNLEAEVTSCHVDRNKLNFGDTISISDVTNDSVGFVNVGVPVNDCSLRIADASNEPLDTDTIGSIQIKGINVTSGYYNNTIETRNCIDQDGWLNTGDLGFIREGRLYITGRAKDIFFVNGQNFYPHDIERVAEAVDGIELNKIIVSGLFNNDTQKEETIAFVFFRERLEKFIPIALSLKSHINAQTGIELDHIIPVNEIPKTTSGKIQRFKITDRFKNGDFREIEQQLQALIQGSEHNLRPMVRPENDTEQKLVGIWKKALGIDTISVTDKFLEVGGNSLKAAEVGMMILKELQVELPTQVLFENATIRELASEVITLDKEAYRPITKVAESETYPLSSAQKRLYFAWKSDKSSVAYNVPIALSIKGEIAIGKLEACLNQLIKRHDTLRMSFEMTSEPRLRVNPMATVDFTLNCKKSSSALLNEVLKSLVQPFDLEKTPLFRIALIEMENGLSSLFLDFHHIISDGISVYNFVNELFQLYNGDILPSLSIQFQDYCGWEKEKLDPHKLSIQEDYWLNHLGQVLPVLELPTDFPRPVVFSGEGGKIQFSFDEETNERLRGLAKENGCTLHVLIFTLYNLLLSKYSGQIDLIVGIPVAGRRHPDVLDMQGMFVNNLAIRTHINKAASFLELLEAEKSNISDAHNHRDYPFEYVVEKISKQRDISRNPIFDTMFNYQNMGLPKTNGEEFAVSWHGFDPGFSKFDLSLEILDDGNDLTYAFEYSTRLFKEATIQGMATNFVQLVKEVLDDPTGKVSGFCSATDEEYDAYIRKFNNTHSAYPMDQAIHQLFDEQVSNAGCAIAVEYNEEAITYQQLGERADRLAAILREKGVKSNTFVAVLLDRSPDFITSILGILKAGGAFLPIAGDLPEERIQYILDDSQCNIVLSTNQYEPITTDWLNASDDLDRAVININTLDLVLDSHAAVENGNMPADLAYVIYTSGTTGGPKGVMIEHQSLVNYIYWAAKTYTNGQEASFPLYTSVSFDLTITSIFIPLITGNKIVIYGETDSLVLNQVVDDNKVNVIKLTPSHLRLFKENDLSKLVARSNIKRFIVGGEALETQLAKDIYHAFQGDIEIYNEYGPTEATVGCMIHRFDPKDDSVTVPIGTPISNTQIYLLDELMKPVPERVYGELYISGDCLARGYLFNEALTNKKFLPSSFINGQRMYKTGDICKRLPSGELEFVRRSDEQVKINGYRVELSEIAYHLKNFEGVSEALAVLKKGKKDNKTLCAYYKSVDNSNRLLEEGTLRGYLANLLPHYMIPAHFIPLSEIPLTKNGKVDVDALPEPDSNPETGETLVPENEIESISLQVWADILDGEGLSVSHNFFELGGDSIKAVQISSRLYEKGINVEAKDILTYQTIRMVSPYVKRVEGDSKYEQGTIKGEVGLSPIISWFLAQNFENPHFFNQSLLLDLDDTVDIKLLEQAFTNLLERHDELRINYDPVKKVLFYNERHLNKDFNIDSIELSNSSELIDACQAVRSSLDIHHDLLLKAVVIRQKSNESKLFITAHHLIMDGVSWRILTTDLYEVYKGLESGSDPYSSTKTASLKDWFEGFGSYQFTFEEERYWKGLESIDFKIPQDFNTNDWRVRNIKRLTRSLDKDQTGFLVQKAHKTYGTNVPMLLNTALVLTLNEWTGGKQFVIEQESHGRHLDEIDVSRTLGWFTSMYPVLLEMEGKSLGEHIKAVKEQLRKVTDHGMGYGIKTFQNSPAETANGLRSEIRFNYLGQLGDELNNDLFRYDPQITGMEIDEVNHATTKMEWNCMVMDGVFMLELFYNSKAYKHLTIERLVDSFFHHLSEVLAHIKKEDDIYFTPSDFEMAGLDQEELDSLF